MYRDCHFVFVLLYMYVYLYVSCMCTFHFLYCFCNTFPFYSVQQAGILHNEILVEMPVTVRISRLAALVLCELGKESEASPQNMLLGLSARYFHVKVMA